MTALVSTETDVELRWVKASELAPNPRNPRRDVGDVSGLAASIRELGVLEPLLVFETTRSDGQLGSQLMLLAGHRRRAAAIEAGDVTVPVVVRPEPSVPEQRIIMLTENGQRWDLTPMEEVVAYQALVSDGMAQKDIARECGRSAAHVSKRLSIGALPGPALKLYDSGDLSTETAYKLTQVADDAEFVERLTSGKTLDEKLIVQDIDRELARRADQKARQAALGQLERDGVHVADPEQIDNSTAVVLVGNEIETLTRTHQFHWMTWLALTIDDHAAESCHGAVVNDKGGVVWVCVDPDAHEDVATQRIWYSYLSADDPPTVESIVDASKPRESSPVVTRQVDPADAERFAVARKRAIERRAFIRVRVADDPDLWPLQAFATAQLAYDSELYPDLLRALDIAGIDRSELGHAERQAKWDELVVEDLRYASVCAALSAIEGTLFAHDTAESERVPYFAANATYGDRNYVPTDLVVGYRDWLTSIGFDLSNVEQVEIDDALAEDEDADGEAE
ncbi:MAG TPA: ParB/RepB/Spo0J family partition protein [Acidimicrobiales bacterium]|nr:ParB/RepB/Spo0J family partition protein [Acidimicrobiales bacterium]